MTRLQGADKRSPQAKAAVVLPPPVPPKGIQFENRLAVARELPKDEVPDGVMPEQWKNMNRAQRRAARKERS